MKRVSLIYYNSNIENVYFFVMPVLSYCTTFRSGAWSHFKVGLFTTSESSLQCIFLHLLVNLSGCETIC